MLHLASFEKHSISGKKMGSIKQECSRDSSAFRSAGKMMKNYRVTKGKVISIPVTSELNKYYTDRL